MKHLKAILSFLMIFSVSSVFSQGLDCATATPYCDAPGGASVTFPNNVNNSSEAGPNYGCLSTHPNPAWFYFKTTTAGNYVFDLGQGGTCGTTTLDVDFICWGPFTNPLTACNNLTAGNTVDCSYSASATEVIDVIGAPAGQYYIVLITNYSNASGCVSFGLQASSPPTDCSITCASVLSGPGIVSYPSTSPLNGTPATPMPASVACNSGLQNMYATNVTPFGNPITPGVMVSFLNNANTSNSVSWLENGSLIGCFGPSASCHNLTTSYSEQLQFSYMSPSATNQFSFCENNTAQPNMTTNIKDLAGGANMPGAPFTWLDDGSCQTINIPPGTVKGITSWTSTCGACLTNVTDWGAAQFNPAAASIGTHTITYTFDSQQPGCTPYTASITITVTNPYNASFTAPGPFCAGAACASFTPSNTYTVGTGTFSGTGVSGSTFCPATSGVGSFPITYTVGVSPTCKATQTNTITVNAIPTANAGSTAALTCTNTSAVLSGSGGGSYSWTGPSGGISSGANTATPTVSLAGTYSLLVTVGSCTNAATVSITQNTATPSVAGAVSNTLTCNNTTVNASATTTMTPVSYNWSGPGITAGAGTGTITANQAGTYNYTVTNTSNGCKTIGSQSVSQNTATPVVAAASSSLNCVVTSVNASATTTTTPVSYNWSGPGITAGAGTGTITLNQPGTYNYTVTNTSNGCKTTGSQAITQNTTAPTVTVSGTQTITCVSPTVTLTGAANPSTATPVWSGGVSSGSNSYTATAASANVYTLTVTNPANGCTSSQAVTVVPSAGFPSLSSPAISNSITCTTNTAQAVVTSTTSNITYSWSGAGITSSTNTPTITVNTGGTYSLVVTNTLSMCSSSITAFVPTNTTTPVPSAVNATTLNCFNSTAALTGGPTSGVTYQWSGPGFSGGTTSQNATATAPGTYTLVVINPISTCSAQATVVVTQNTVTPVVNSAASNTLTCLNTSVNASATTTTSPVSYNWTGTGIISATNISTITVNQPGTFNYTVTNTTNGCSTIGSQAVVQNTTSPVVASAVSGVLNCTLTSVNASATTTTTPVSYNWSGTGITSATNISTITVNQPGTFNYTVTNTSNGCSVGGSQTVTQNTTAPVVTSGVSSVLNCTTTSVNANATTTTTPVSYNWSGTGITSATNISTITVNQGGTYNYTVTNTSNGCTTTGSQAVTQNTTAPSAAANDGTLTCQILSTSLIGSPSSGVTYSWAGPGLTGATNLSTATATATGVYTLVTTSTANGCTSTAVSTVTDNLAVPNADAGLTQTLVCGVSSVTLTGSSSTPGASGLWFGGVCGSATSLTTTACSPGTYTLLVTHPTSGCTSTSTVSVNSSTNVPQATVNAITNSITCTNSVVAIGVTLTNPDPVSYSWSGPGVSGSSVTAATTASLGGTYSVTITNTVSNCQSIYSVIVPDDLNPVSANVAPSNSITCSTTSVSLLASPTGTNYSYSWIGAGNITNGTTENPTVDAGGNYIVTITNNINGCNGTYTINVPTNTTVPTLSLTANSLTTTCGTPTITLGASSDTDPNSTYTWTVSNGGTLNNTNISNPVAGSGGSYAVTVTNTVNGCYSAPQTVTVTADANIPTFTLTSNSASLTCLNTTQTVTVNTTASNLTYSWTPTPLSGGSSSTPTFDAPGVYVCVITNTLNNCSTGAAQVTVTSNTNVPTITPASNLSVTCSSTLVTITSVSTPSTNVSYAWSGTGIVGSNSGSSIDVNSAGNYDVIITDLTNGCSSTVTATVGSNTIVPTLTLTSTTTTLSCAASTITLSATASVTDTPTWSTPSGASANPVIAGVAGDYIANITDASNGCSFSQTLTITGSTVSPTADAGANVTIPCGSLSTLLNGTTTSTDVVTYNWSGPSATSISGPTNIQNPTATESGVYTLTVTNTSNGCSSTATVNVVQSTVTASISATPTDGISPLTVNFDGSGSTGATSYSWNFGDGNVAGNVNPSNIFTTGGSYTVTLIASASPCSDTATIVITVNDGLTLEIPNVFTPNGDGSNDIFTIKSTGVKEISLQIFNRWGQKLYEFTGPKASWDGKVPNGGSAPEGTYFYFVKATGFDEKEIEQNGTVNLFR
ncbi:MAG: gliding motility-associated C-terminal domain-containing protein [Bacteroidia bacterium]